MTFFDGALQQLLYDSYLFAGEGVPLDVADGERGQEVVENEPAHAVHAARHHCRALACSARIVHASQQLERGDSDCY
jgi:hypothetical protein